jgi:hypothetical protein
VLVMSVAPIGSGIGAPTADAWRDILPSRERAGHAAHPGWRERDRGLESVGRAAWTRAPVHSAPRSFD